MPSELFFLPTPPQNPLSSIQSDTTGCNVPPRSSKPNAADESLGAKCENFLSTLKEATQTQNPASRSSELDQAKSSETEAFDSTAEPDKSPNAEECHDDVSPAIAWLIENYQLEGEIENTSPLNFLAFVNALGVMGFNNSPEGSVFESKTDVAQGVQDGSAALKKLLALFQQNDLTPSSNMMAGLKRLQQLIANAPATRVALQTVGNSINGLAQGQLSESAFFEQLIKGIYPGEEGQKGGPDAKAPENTSVKMPSGTNSVVTHIATEPASNLGETGFFKSAENSENVPRSANREKTEPEKWSAGTRSLGVDVNANAKETTPLNIDPKDASAAKDESDIQGKSETSGPVIHLNRIGSSLDHRHPSSSGPAPENKTSDESSLVSKMTKDSQGAKTLDHGQPNGAEPVQETKAPDASSLVSKVTRDVQAAKALDYGKPNGAEPAPENKTPDESSLVSKMTRDPQAAKALGHRQPNIGEPVQETKVPDASSLVSKMTRDVQAAEALGNGKPSGSEPDQETKATSETPLVAKMIRDAQAAREGYLKMDTVISDEPGIKVARVDAGTNENMLLNTQSQTAEKALEALSSTKETEAGQDTLRSQTLDQIVRKAVIHLRNGQHEAKIDLKPDYLGHIRMQVITENQQVTVKILAEFSFVKDMIENNVHQLKLDLQQQGLSVDKLEVTVSHDSDEHKHPQEKTARSNARQGNMSHNNTDNPKEETRELTGHSGITATGASTVDFFA